MHLELINLELNLNSSRKTLEKKKSQTFINLELILNITNYAE